MKSLGYWGLMDLCIRSMGIRQSGLDGRSGRLLLCGEFRAWYSFQSTSRQSFSLSSG